MTLVGKFFTVFLLTSFLLCSCNHEKVSDNNYFTIKGYAQGTTYSITYQDSLKRNFASSIDSILKRIDLELSTYDSSSFISELNNSKDTCLNLSGKDLFLFCFRYSKKIHDKTSGSFNPAVYPLVNYWGFYNNSNPKIDSLYITDSLLNYTNLHKSFEIDSVNDQQFLCKNNIYSKLDFNGVAQGYSVDVITDYFDISAIENYFVEVGGEISVNGLNPNNNLWKIGIDQPIENSSPGENEFQKIIELNNQSLATSGSYRKFKIINGQKVSHSINPTTGFPANNNLLSVTVICDQAANADALATSFMVMGKEKAIDYIIKNRKDSIMCYMVYDSINKTREWSNF
jgi:thiamine biosynthesis lipoprotein